MSPTQQPPKDAQRRAGEADAAAGAVPEHPDAQPTVSAVIPAYNAADTIARALDSVYAQIYPNIIEVVVVDDGSTDSTAQIVRDKYPDVTLIQQENAGNAGARNTGVDAAAGEYIAFLDADDEWLPDKTQTQVEVICRHPGIGLLTCGATVHDPPADGAPAPAPAVHLSCLTFRDVLHRELPKGVQLSCSGWLMRANVLRGYGGLDAALRRAVDWEFLLRLTGLGYSLTAISRPLYRYHVRSDSVSHSPAMVRALSHTEIDLIHRYDPRSDGWQGELLTPEEFRAALSAEHAFTGWRLWSAGDRQLAREHLARAAELSDARGLRALRRRLAAWNPGLCRALLRLQIT